MNGGRLTAPQFRRELLELVGRALPLAERVEDLAGDNGDELPGGGIPTAVLIVAEWQADDGKRWLSSIAALGNGDLAPIWTARMLAREALYWDDDDRDNGDR